MKLASSESVTEGHPDKICDQISDAILDAALEQDSESRVAIEAMVTPNLVHLGGEIRSLASLDFELITRAVLERIGKSETLGLPYSDVEILKTLNIQSPEISAKVERKSEDSLDRLGAGDQGVMFGYACKETPELMPLPILIAHDLSNRLTEKRKSGEMPYLRPDGKTQAVWNYKAKKIESLVISTQHEPDVDSELLVSDCQTQIIKPMLERFGIENKIDRLLINPAGSFVLGGASADTGLTGRKIIVDSYGGTAHHGGGAFSGKDATKVDRSGAYVARWVAKHIVALNLAERVEIQIAYAIGEPQPIGINIETFGTQICTPDWIAKAVSKTFDFRPAAIIEELQLTDPIFSQTSVGGHFGKESLPWEKVNKLKELERNLP